MSQTAFHTTSPSDTASRPTLDLSAAPMIEAPMRSAGEPQRPRGRIWWLAIGAVALAFGLGWFAAGGSIPSRHPKESLPAESENSRRDPSVALVTVEPVARRVVQRAVTAIGTLHGFEEVVLSAEVEGRVRAVRADVSDRVAPGDLLLEIEPLDFELALEQAERTLQVELAKLGLAEPPEGAIDLEKVPSVMQARTRLENARAKHDRAKQLAARRAISTELLDDAASEVRSTEAEHANQLLVGRAGLATIRSKQSALAIARQQLDDTRIRAPVPTKSPPGGPVESRPTDTRQTDTRQTEAPYAVAKRFVSEGTLVRAGTEVFKLVLDRTLKARVPVPERFAADVKVGQRAEVSTAAAARPAAGTVRRINPTVEPATRTFEVEIEVPNPDGSLKPGSFAQVSILTRRDEQAATAPLSALVQFAGVNKIFLLENDRAREVQVVLGMQTAEWVEIASPALPEGARVVTSGQSVLAEGTPIAVRPASEPETKSEER